MVQMRLSDNPSSTSHANTSAAGDSRQCCFTFILADGSGERSIDRFCARSQFIRDCCQHVKDVRRHFRHSRFSPTRLSWRVILCILEVFKIRSGLCMPSMTRISSSSLIGMAAVSRFCMILLSHRERSKGSKAPLVRDSQSKRISAPGILRPPNALPPGRFPTP